MKAIALALLGVFLAVPSAAAQCGPRAVVEQVLWQEYGERPVGRALQHDGYVIEVWASEDGESFTITLTRSDGVACIVSFGEAWESLAWAPLGQAS